MNELYAQHFEELARFCTMLCRNAEKGADLAQETFLRALEQARRNARFLERQQLLYEGEGAEESGYAQTDAYLILCRLPQELQTLMRLRYIEGYSAAELGELFHMPPATVRTKLSRARQLLRKELYT